MNREHLQAFLWLRWRLLANQCRRAGPFNAVLMMIVAIGALITAIPLFIGCFVLGTYAIPKAAPVHLMYAWDALLAAFLLFWGIGLLTELQRNDPLSLSRFLHLPVSVNGAFLINYLSSLLSLSLIVFGPMMLGYSLALVYVKGTSLLIVLPLLAAFLLMVTALTYQFQGWLASLMSNPRRRRSVLMGATAIFILVFQLPNLFNMLSVSGTQNQSQRAAALKAELAKLDLAFKSREIDASEFSRRREEAREKDQAARREAHRRTEEKWEKWAQLGNMVLPVGWLPLGVKSAAEGRALASGLGLLGMTLIGSTSLWRAYRTTIGLYQGKATGRKGRPVPAVAPTTGARKPGSLLLEARLPGLSEPVSAIALGGFRSLLRAPEAKMALLTPLMTGVIFGSMIFSNRHGIPVPFRPLIAIGGMVFSLLGVLQLAANQFGFDRDGFRVFVLCAAPRRDILLGKNLAFAPMTLGLCAIFLTIVQVFCPMRLDHLLALLPEFITLFVLSCTLMNMISIFAPIYIASGSLNPAKPKLTNILMQMVMFLVLFPLTQIPAFLPLGVEAYVEFMGWSKGIPISLIVALVECIAVVPLYLLILEWQGRLLQAREQLILETVTNRAH